MAATRTARPVASPDRTRKFVIHRGGGVLAVEVLLEREGGVYRPNVDRVFELDDVVAAHRYMEKNQAAGKVVLVP